MSQLEVLQTKEAQLQKKELLLMGGALREAFYGKEKRKMIPLDGEGRWRALKDSLMTHFPFSSREGFGTQSALYPSHLGRNEAEGL